MTAAYSTHASVSSSTRFPSPSYRENGEHGIALVTGGHGYLDGQGRRSQPLAALDLDRVGERCANSRSRRPGRIGSGGERASRPSASRERRQRCPSRTGRPTCRAPGGRTATRIPSPSARIGDSSCSSSRSTRGGRRSASRSSGNSAAVVRGPKHAVTKGHEAGALARAEARKLLESIDTGALAPGPGAAIRHALRAGERGSSGCGGRTTSGQGSRG